MSSNDILTTPTRPEEFNSERLNQSVNNSPVEPKQSIENVLLESKRLIKSGFYKKAFNLVESLKAEEVYIPPLASIKLSRRMVICLTRICTRYLTKGDLHRVDHFIKLMNKSFDYMQTWHDLLCSYISKTNPKFNHLRKILTEPSELYEEVLQTGEMARIKIKIPASTQNNLSILSTAESREGKQVNLINRFRQNLMTPKDSGSHYLEDASRLDQESQLLGADNLSGREINASFHLDEFIKYYLISLLNWANFYKTAAKKYDLAYRFLMFAHKLTKVLDSCLDPEVLQLISKIRVALGVLYSEFGRQKEALEILESALNLLQIELSRRISKNKEVKNSSVQMERFKETIRQIILVSMNMAIIYEQRENYARTLESLRLGVWFAGKFLISGDDLYNLINMQYNVASQRYDKYLKELGELERVVPEKKDLNEVEDVQETKTSNHVAKMNYYLYNKFNYERLNANQYIVLTSPSGIDKDMHVKNNKSEFLTEDRTEFGESKNWSRLRDLKTEGSFARTATMEDLDMQYTSNSVTWKRQSTMTKPNNNIRDKKKFRLDTSEDAHTLTSRKYQTEGAFEHDKEEFQLDSEDEREHIEKLNRNIKSKRKLIPSKNGGKLDYLDVDNFFNKVVDKRIQEKEEELKIGQPKQFKKIVKDYGYFLKSEKFDEIEFGFAARTLTARGRENLGEYEISTKYKPPTFKVAQRNEVKIEAQHIEARFSTENKITSRNQSIKSSQVKSPQAKMVKFATSTSGRETKTGTLLAIDEQPSTTRSNHLQGLGGKHTFTGILMRHHEDLGLNTVHDVVSEKEKKALKLAARMKEKSEMKTLGLLSPSALNRFETPKSSMSARSRSNIRRFNTQDISKFAETTKNTIQLMMETIEKNIEEGEDIKHRIEYNKPLIEVQKPTDKFLKVPDELAKSTVNLSFKAQGSKKIWNFSQLVKNSHLANKKTVTIKAP